MDAIKSRSVHARYTQETKVMTTLAVNMEEALETFYARRRQVDEFSQEPRHNSFFYQGKWHRCACPECRQKHAEARRGNLGGKDDDNDDG